MSTLDDVKNILRRTLQLGVRVDTLTEYTRLLGNLPELDSMAVVAVIAAIEDRFGFVVEDDEISAETFETVGSLVDFVNGKREAA